MPVLHPISEFVFPVSATGTHNDIEDNLPNQNCYSIIIPGIFTRSSALFKQQHKNRQHPRGENLQMHHRSALCCALQLNKKQTSTNYKQSCNRQGVNCGRKQLWGRPMTRKETYRGYIWQIQYRSLRIILGRCWKYVPIPQHLHILWTSGPKLSPLPFIHLVKPKRKTWWQETEDNIAPSGHFTTTAHFKKCLSVLQIFTG